MKISIIILPLFSITSLKIIINSISGQSYSHYEVIIIGELGMNFGYLADANQNMSSKIKIIQNTGGSVNPILQALLKSSGDLIWIVDCLDEFHPEKLKLHVKLFNENPAIDGIRSAFVMREAENIYHSLKTVNSRVDLENVLLGEPIHFSDGIFRRKRVEKFFSNSSIPEPCSLSSLSLYFYTQALLAGCQMIGLNQTINLRYKLIEQNSDLKSSAESAIRCLDHLFAIPEVGPSIAKWKDKATAQAYLQWSIKAFENEETELGQTLFRSSILLNRSILDIGALAYFNILIGYALQDGDAIHRVIEKNISQLSPEFAWMSQYLNESIARGYFLKAVDEIAFGKFDCADQSISQANSYGINLTQLDLIEALSILSDHEEVFGFDAVKPNITYLARLDKFVDQTKINWIRSTWFINLAFEKYRKNNYRAVPQKVINALLISPRHIFNHGVSSVFFKSLFGIVKNHFQTTNRARQAAKYHQSLQRKL